VLHPYLKERLAGRFPVDIAANINEVQAKLFSIEESERQREISVILDSLGPELEAGKSYVGGLDDVLAAINERRVDMLIAESGYSEPGRLCNACNTIAFAEETCPSCRLDMKPLSDIVEEAKELAVRQDARLITVEPGHPALKQAGGIAARLRY
jgi:peptide subunit release factor 1 (eRF1)